MELKYPTALWVGDVASERFELKNHGAQDILAYDVVKDTVRVERVPMPVVRLLGLRRPPWTVSSVGLRGRAHERGRHLIGRVRTDLSEAGQARVEGQEGWAG